MRSSLLLLVAISMTGCTPKPATGPIRLTVAELWHGHKRLGGREVEVTGVVRHAVGDTYVCLDASDADHFRTIDVRLAVPVQASKGDAVTVIGVVGTGGKKSVIKEGRKDQAMSVSVSPSSNSDQNVNSTNKTH